MKRALPFLLLTAIALASLTVASLLPAARAADDVVRIPVSEISDTAKYYKIDADGVTVKYFLIKAPDGTIRSALDACDVCFPAKKGYKQSGEFMICTNCGQRFHASRIALVKGGCNPHPLKNTIEGDNVVISKAELAEGVRYFK